MDAPGELLHLIVQTIRHVLKDIRPGAIGHVIDYDPTLHALRIAAPGYPVVDAQGNVTGEFGQTSWLQLGTMEGHQAAPHVGDASKLDGDQYYVFIIERGEGTAVVVSKTYNDKEPPPFQDLLPGEWGYKNRDSKAYIRYHQNGFVEVVGDGGQKITFDQNGDPDGTIRLQASDQQGEIILQGIMSPQIVSLNSDGSITIKGANSSFVGIDNQGNITMSTAGNTQIQLIAPKIVLGGNVGAPAIARVGDTVTSDGTPGGTFVGKIATGSAIAQCS